MVKCLLVVMAWLLAIGAAMAQPNFAFYEPVQPPRGVQIMVHRGMHMLAPENTLPAIDGCFIDYVEWAEIDVRLTKDGHHVIVHDDNFARTAGMNAKVADLTLAEVQKLDAGSWFAPRFAKTPVPTLAEVLETAKGKVNLYLDCKQINPELLVKEVIAAKMQRQVIVYDRPAVLAKIRTLSGGTIPGMTKYRVTVDFDTFVQEVQPAAVEIDADEVSAELCQKFHGKGIKVQAKVLGGKWDNPTVWNRMIDAGVDWLQTDDPAGLRFTEVRRRIDKFPVKISCHRGANRYAPENTLPAVKAAVQFGADFVEIDIRPTKNGRFMLLHDATLNRTTTGKGPIRDISFDDLQTLSAGKWFGKPFENTRVPTLDDMLMSLGTRSGVYLDAKDIPPEALLGFIKKYDLFERHVIYQSVDYASRIQKLDPRVRCIPALRNRDAFDQVAAIKPYGVDANWSILSAEMIAKCHAANIRVFSDALGFHETVPDYRKAIRWGIDAIQTDFPLRVLRAIELEAAAKK